MIKKHLGRDNKKKDQNDIVLSRGSLRVTTGKAVVLGRQTSIMSLAQKQRQDTEATKDCAYLDISRS